MAIHTLNDAYVIGALHHAPASTDWTDLTSASFADQSQADGAGGLDPAAVGLPFSLIMVDASACAGAVFVKLSPRLAAGDTTANTLRVPAGAVAKFGMRGLQGPSPANSNIYTISVSLASAGDTVYLTSEFDKAPS